MTATNSTVDVAAGTWQKLSALNSIGASEDGNKVNGNSFVDELAASSAVKLSICSVFVW